ncbi:putative ubiquitin-protein ligase-like [Trypanosoma conorhini]|uniref:Putative ubiquitin-protein ligase-like n=1 Tax=Trypanosoma conorhini TaxID=83891 RepID=A0A422PFG9_9TRYP|nr:putative ubiquitin-protein ligase-like [Trypanosoma conorhini]RNF16457.1 putative ubiquitin-protein ligase-like [Trypanosoma conorhini]
MCLVHISLLWWEYVVSVLSARCGYLKSWVSLLAISALPPHFDLCCSLSLFLSFLRLESQEDLVRPGLSVLVSRRMSLGSVCRLRVRSALAGAGGDTCGCCRYARFSAASAGGVSGGAASPSTPKAAASAAPPSPTIPRRWIGELAAQVHEKLCLDHWQAAMRLLSAFPPAPQGAAAGTTTPRTSSCESLIAELLYQGHGESAFAVWRIASPRFNFAPSPTTMVRFAVYTLLVDRKPQEALDLVAMATLPAEDAAAAGPPPEHFALWTTVVAALASFDDATGSRNRIVQVEGEVETAFVGLLRLSLQPLRQGETRLGVERLQLGLHALVSLVLRDGGSEALQSLCSTASFVLRDAPSLDSLLRVVKLLCMEPVECKSPAFVFADVPFLVARVLPLPLVCASEASAPLLSGLEVYRSFFIGMDGPRPSDGGNASFPFITATNAAVHTTVGDVLLRRLLQLNVEPSLLLCSVVLHDINTTSTSLTTRLLELSLSRDLCDTLCHSFGRQFVSVAKRLVQEASLRGARPMPLLGFVSRAVGPFLRTDVRHYEAAPHTAVNGSCIGRSIIFYIALLANLVAEVPTAEVTEWRRFLAHVTRKVVKGTDHGCRAAISQELRLQLHLRWWLPELLTLVDPTRDCLLSAALQHAVPPSSLTEWDQTLSAVLRTLHRKEHGNMGGSRLCWASFGSAAVQDELNAGEVAECSHGVHRLLVRRLVRWEWLLKALWEFTRDTCQAGRHSTWKRLLDVCAETLSRCRVYHRHDIAKELIETLLLPAAPFLPPAAEPSTKGTWCGATLIGLLIRGPSEICVTDGTLMEPRWRLVDEVSRWMPVSQGWDCMRDLQALLPRGPHDAAHRFLSLEHLIIDLSSGEGRDAVPGAGERGRVGKVFEWYEEACRGDLSLRTPQLLLPLARAMRRASLPESVSELVRNTFCDIRREFQAPQPASTSRLLLEALLFYSAQLGLATARTRLGVGADALVELSPAAYAGARGMVAAFAETYILTLWQHDCFPALDAILLKPAAQNAEPTESPSSSAAVPKAIICEDYFVSAEIAYLLPAAEREALRLFLLLAFAQRCDSFLYTSALGRLPRSKTDAAKVAAFVDRLVAQEPSLFAALGAVAQRVAQGKWRLSEACASVAASHAKAEAKQEAVDSRGRGRNEVRTIRDLNRCIDNCDWVTALQATPHVLIDPLHVARKALLACEKAPKGMAWQGAMSIFANSEHAWKQQSSENSLGPWQAAESFRFRASIGIQECGRIMMILADARRWREALQVFELLGPSGMDGFTFSQACFALSAGSHPELAIDLWATWRAHVGDTVEPTAQMCGHFLRCGVAGNTAVADAACVLLKLALHAHACPEVRRNAAGPSSSAAACTPGTALPLSLEEGEDTIIALLRDRWHESWQEALRVALVSERPRIIHAVARNSPSNYHVYEAVVQQATRDRRRLSLEERCTIAGHLDLKTAFAAKGSSVGGGEDRAARVLQELLGDEDED